MGDIAWSDPLAPYSDYNQAANNSPQSKHRTSNPTASQCQQLLVFCAWCRMLSTPHHVPSTRPSSLNVNSIGVCIDTHRHTKPARSCRTPDVYKYCQAKTNVSLAGVKESRKCAAKPGALDVLVAQLPCNTKFPILCAHRDTLIHSFYRIPLQVPLQAISPH